MFFYYSQFSLDSLQQLLQFLLIFSMGVCPCQLSPEIRVINSKNQQLKTIVENALDGLDQYPFAKLVMETVNSMQLRFMYNLGILQDIQKIHNYGQLSGSRHTQNSISQTVEQDLQNSCLIMQNQMEQSEQAKPAQGQNYDSFQVNLKNNKSLVGIINILYRREIRLEEYSHSLQFFLKWANIFQEHSYGGFLRPIYKTLYQHIKTVPKDEFTSIVDEICVFVQFMVTVLTEIYGLKGLAQLQIGKLIKNENVYNLVMSILFKKYKIKKFLVECIRENEQSKISRFQKQLFLFNKKPTYFFGISKKFTLYETNLTESQIFKSMEVKSYVQPYEQSLKLVNQLCNSGSPVTKLKIIIAVSKQIMRDIEEYYVQKGKEVPQLDPDNLSSIVMYLLARTNNKNIYEELKLVEHFTTTNCLNCISGYYLNVFNASIESILELEDRN